MPSTKVTGGFKQKVNSSKPRRGLSLVWNFCLTVPHPAIALGQSKGRTVFIVQAKPREPEGIVKVTKDTRKDALATADQIGRDRFAPSSTGWSNTVSNYKDPAGHRLRAPRLDHRP